MWFNEYNSENCFNNALNMMKYRKWITDNEIKTAKDLFEASSDKNIINGIPFTNIINNEYKKFNLILYFDEESIDINKLDMYLRKESETMKILIYHPDLFSSKLKAFDKPKDTSNWIELVNINYLIINLPTHILSSKHEIIDNTQEIFQKGQLWDSRLLETIYHSDPQAKYIGAKVNDIIKITVPGEKIKYRKCVFGYVD